MHMIGLALKKKGIKGPQADRKKSFSRTAAARSAKDL
jgi:hypothetical protein